MATVYEKMMEFLVKHHEGSFEKFMLSILKAEVKEEKNKARVGVEMATIVRKPAFSKWKRARYIHNFHQHFLANDL